MEEVNLTPQDVKAVDADKKAAFAENAAKVEAIEKELEGAAPPPSGEGAPPPSSGPEVFPEATPEEVDALLEYCEDFFDPEEEIPDSPLFWRLNEKERKRVSKPLAACLNKYVPWIQTEHPEALALAICLAGIGAGRWKRKKARAKATEAAKAGGAAKAA